jgi:transcriptional regulator with XRE-family HTH domain
MDLTDLRTEIASRRKAAHLSQAELALRANVSLPTVRALEQGRMPELGYSKIVRLLAALNLVLELREANRGRPTLDTLRSENSDD